MENEKGKETYRRIVKPEYGDQIALDIGLAAFAFIMCVLMGMLFGMAVVQYVPMALVSGTLVYVRGFAWWFMNRKITYEKETYY